jgi:hypothetical protein
MQQKNGTFSPVNAFRTYAFLIFCFSCLNAFTQVKVYDVSRAAQASKGGGSMYTLPQTKLRTEAIVKQSVYEKGSLYDYDWLIQNKFVLQKYLNYTPNGPVESLKNKKEHTVYALKDADVTVKTFSVADHKKTYLVQVNRKPSRGTNITLKTGEDGILQSVDQTIDNQTFEIVAKGLVGVGKIAMNLSGGALFPGFSKTMEDKAKELKVEPKKLTRTDTLNALLNQVQEIEKEENNLKKGAVSVQSLDLLKEMLDKLNTRRLEVLALIAYAETTKLSSYIFDCTPSDTDSVNTFRLFSFTKEHGLLTKNNAKEEGPRFYTVQQPDTVSGDSVYALSFSVKSNKNAATFTNSPATDDMDNYYRYNIPAKAVACIKKGGKLVAGLESVYPQWGTLGYLRTKDAKTVFSVDANGALSSLTLERKAWLSPDKAASVTDAADKYTVRRDKQQEEIDALTKKKTLLELQKQLAELMNTPQE